MATATRSKTIDPDVLAVLRAATVEGHHVNLNGGTLDKDLYKRTNEVLTRLGGKWKGGKTAAHVFDRDPTPLLAEVLGSGLKPAKNPLNFYPTPLGVVMAMLERADLPTAHEGPVLRILEPSAGEGAIAEAILETRTNVIVRCVEVDPVRAGQLRAKGYAVVEGDFLNTSGWPGTDKFDRVIMNPPLECPSDATVYVDHVLHAFAFLKPGGRLVAVCPNGFTFAQTRKLTTFRDWVDEHGHWLDLASGVFRESGTDVNVCLIVVDKPA